MTRFTQTPVFEENISDCSSSSDHTNPCTSPLVTCNASQIDSMTASNSKFLEVPPVKCKKSKRKKKKIKKVTEKRCRRSSKNSESMPASIPEENSEDIISSDPDIETVEYVKKVEYDNQNTVHSVHQIFAELDELVREEGEDVWEEKARWIKFEQDIFRGADKWSKPHVATLRLQSIIGLRKCLAGGTVLLGMNAFDLESVIEMLLDRLVSRALITSTVALQLHSLLLKRHVHIGEHQDMLKFRYKKHRRRGFLSRISEGLSPNPSPQSSRLPSRNNSEQDLNKIKQQFLRKLPADTEASNVMIGKLDYLEVPLCVTIRLNHSILLGDVTEVPIPTRFIFLLLCPPNSPIDHVEVGRAASTLFSDEMFYKAAYSASSKAHLIQGIDRFLEKAIVIPPGEWDPKMKIVFPEEESSPDQLSDKEDEVPRIDDIILSHRFPLSGIRSDIDTLRSRWVKDWKRGIRRVPLLCPVQYSVVALAYVLFLIQLSFKSLAFSPFSGLCSVGMFGVVCSLVFCQPLLMCSVSLPVVLWEVAVSRLCTAMGISYTEIRALVGITTGILLITCSLLNTGNMLTAVSMFVYEAAIAAIPFSLFLVILLSSLAAEVPSRSEPVPDTVVCSIVVLLATLVFLKLWHGLSASTVFSKKIRSIFCVFDGAALILMISLIVHVIPLRTVPYDPSFLQPLQPFPDTLLSLCLGVATGGVLALLIFLQYGLVFNWVVQPNHKLKRLHGKYYDQCIIGLGTVISGLYHFPFLVPDPLLTGVFVHMLNNTRDRVLYLREQRVTQLLSGILVALPAVLVSQLHLYIPLPMCWGVVLFYSGVCLSNTQLYERSKLLFQAEKYHPERSYVENTPQNVINSYTISQLISVVVLVAGHCAPYLPSSLPFLLLLLIFLRSYLLPFLIFENLILLLEDKRSPVAVKCISPSPSLTPDTEFAEEVGRISNGHFGPPDVVHPQVIFDNLTDNDTPEAHEVQHTSAQCAGNVERASSMDFLADPTTMAYSLPFEYGVDEPIKSENLYSSSAMQPSLPYLDLYP